MRRSRRFAPVLLLLIACPALAWAQSSGGTSRNVGVVTTLAGDVTVARAALPSPQPLRFKDDVFLRDRISTAERSIVRVLLGGKALITVRELSALTITEETGRSTIALSAGKVAMGVLRQRMRPGEVIEIRTPNAIAAIRGTVLVVELITEPGGSSGAPRYTTKVHVLHGLVEVSDPKNPGAPPAQVGALETWSRTGSDPSALAPLSPAAVEQVFAGLHSPPQISEGPREFIQSVTTREQAKAVAVAEFLAPGAVGAGAGGDRSAPAAPASAGGTTTPGIADAPVVPTIVRGPSAGGGPTLGPTGLARIIYDGQTVASRGSLYSLSGGLKDGPTVPILEATSSSLAIGQSLMDVSGGATLSSTGAAPLLFLDPTKLSATSLLTLSGGGQFSLAGTLFQDQSGGLDLRSDLLHLSGGATFVGNGASALVDLVGSSASTASGLLSASGGAAMDLIQASAPLLSLTRSAALTTGSSFADISGGATVRLGQLASLTASALTIRGHAVNLSGATLNVAGDLFRLDRGSTLTITGGALLNVSSGAILNVSGALVNFLSTGNTLNVANNLCAGGACTTVGGLRVLITGGGSLNLSNPILNAAGNTLNFGPDAAVISVSGATVTQGR